MKDRSVRRRVRSGYLRRERLENGNADAKQRQLEQWRDVDCFHPLKPARRKKPLINSAHGTQEITCRVTLILLTLRSVLDESERERFILSIKNRSTMKKV